MRLQTLKLWNNYKRIWLILLGWALFSLMMLVWLSMGLSDYDGFLPKIQPEKTARMDAEGIERIEFEVEGVALEVAGSYDSQEISAFLYGPGYAGQEINVYRQGNSAYIKLWEYLPIANGNGFAYQPELTLRVIVPKRAYALLKLECPLAEVSLTRLRGDKLVIEAGSGQVRLEDVQLQQVQLTSESADLQIYNSKINDLDLTNRRGQTQMERSQFTYLHYQSDSGHLVVQSNNIKGVWQLGSKSGDITVQTRDTPFNLLCDFSTNRGTLAVSYQKYHWEELLTERLQAQNFQGVIGSGTNILKITSEKGQIAVGRMP